MERTWSSTTHVVSCRTEATQATTAAPQRDEPEAAPATQAGTPQLVFFESLCEPSHSSASCRLGVRGRQKEKGVRKTYAVVRLGTLVVVPAPFVLHTCVFTTVCPLFSRACFLRWLSTPGRVFQTSLALSILQETCFSSRSQRHSRELPREGSRCVHRTA